MSMLGMEFGSTRIKAVAIDGACRVIASGAHDWENALKNGMWTYSLEDARGFAEFMKRYEKGLAIERAAVENLK